MNKLTSKNKNISNEIERFNCGTYAEKIFDRKTLNTTVIGGAKLTEKRKPKYLYVSLAMMESKGLNTEDKIIFRRDRFFKGGVVDLAQEKLAKKSKYKIKKVNAIGL